MSSVSATSTIATAFDTLMSSGELVDEAVFRERSGLTPAQLSAAVDAGRVFRLEVGRARGYPSFLLDPSLDRSQLEAVAELLVGCAAGTKFSFFTTPRGSLATPGPIVDGVLTGIGTPRTPLHALREREFESVKRVALSSMGR